MPDRPAARARWRAARSRLAPGYAVELEAAVGPATQVLDVGCGSDSPLRAFRVPPPELVGVEAHPPAAAAARASGCYDAVLEADVRSLAGLFPPTSFDVVVAVDVLEHLERTDGFDLLEAMEQLARQRVVVFTPNGFVAQGAREGNPYQVHRSGWTTEDFTRLGYSVRGVHGWRILRAEEARIRWRPVRFWALVADLTQPAAARRPGIAYHLLSVKQFSLAA